MISKNIPTIGDQSFEQLKQSNDHGAEFWSARDLQPLLGYSQWRRFEDAVKRAITSCEQSGNNPGHHFAGAGKPIIGGKGAVQTVDDYPPNPNRGWSKSRAVFEAMIAEGRVLFPKLPTGRPREKKFLADLKSDVTGFSTWLDSQDVGFSTDGTREVTELLGFRAFDFPKSLGLLKTLVEQASSQDGIVLDFFAGSGTTAHAVLDLNQQDGGNRKFILAQLPEKTDNPQYQTIAHITRERVRRVIAKQSQTQIPPSPPFAKGGIKAAGTLFAEPMPDEANPPLQKGGRGDFGFRAFKLDSSNFKIWRSDQAPQSAEQLAKQLNLYADNVLAERGDQDWLYEFILKCGMPLSARVEEIQLPVRPELVEGQVVHASTSDPSTGSGGCPTKSSMGRTAFSIADGNLLICLEPHLDRNTLRALFARKPQMVLCLDTAFDGNDALKTNTVLEAQTHGIIFKTV